MQEMQETSVLSLDQEDPLEKETEPTPVFLLGKSYGQRRWATVHGVTKSQTQLSMHVSHMTTTCMKSSLKVGAVIFGGRMQTTRIQ